MEDRLRHSRFLANLNALICPSTIALAFWIHQISKYQNCRHVDILDIAFWVSIKQCMTVNLNALPNMRDWNAILIDVHDVLLLDLLGIRQERIPSSELRKMSTSILPSLQKLLHII